MDFQAITPILRYILGAIACVTIGIVIERALRQNHPNTPKPPVVEDQMDVVAWVGRITGILFWSFYWWDHFHPETTTGFVSYMSWMLVVGLGVAHPLGLPLLVAKAFPKDPWHLYVQEKSKDTRSEKILLWTTIGWSFASAIMILTWVGQALGITSFINLILTTITFVVISVILPAFSMLQMVPKHWKAIADMMEELDLRRRRTIVEEIEIEESLRQAIILMSIDPLQLLIDQRKEHEKAIIDILGGVFQRYNESGRTIINLLNSMSRGRAARSPIRHLDDSDIYTKLEEIMNMERGGVLEIQEPTQRIKQAVQSIFH